MSREAIFPHNSRENEFAKQYFFDGTDLYIIDESRYTRYEIVPYGDSAFALVTETTPNRFDYSGEQQAPEKRLVYFVISIDY